MTSVLETLKWFIWTRRPQWMPHKLQQQILELSPYVCVQIGQGSSMVVMHREVWESGGYEGIPGAPSNLKGVYWIIREWMRTHPGWRP